MQANNLNLPNQFETTRIEAEQKAVVAKEELNTIYGLALRVESQQINQDSDSHSALTSQLIAIQSRHVEHYQKESQEVLKALGGLKGLLLHFSQNPHDLPYDLTRKLLNDVSELSFIKEEKLTPQLINFILQNSLEREEALDLQIIECPHIYTINISEGQNVKLTIIPPKSEENN